MEGIKNGKVLRHMMDDENNALPLPQSLQESLDSLKKDELLLSILGDELSTAYTAVRELEARTETTLEEEVGGTGIVDWLTKDGKQHRSARYEICTGLSSLLRPHVIDAMRQAAVVQKRQMQLRIASTQATV
eukprot:scaffold13802_cov94-Skeletonema_dohrnii-CCMP3373.AAC.1